MIRRETEGFGSLSLGAETWRVFAGHVLWLLIAGAVSLPLLLAPASSSTTLQISGEGAFGEVSAQASLLVVGLGAGWAVAMVISSLRLAPGNAASIARRRFAYFDALRVSAGRSSALLGSFALVGLISAVGAATLFLGGSLIIYSATLFAVDHQRLFNLLMFFDLFASIIAGHLLFIFLSAGVNARAALAAIDSGKLAGVLPETVKTFD